MKSNPSDSSPGADGGASAAPLNSASPPNANPTARVTRRRRLWFRVGVVLFPVLLLALINGGLSLCGYGVDTTFILPARRVGAQARYLNPRADFVYGLTELRGPEPRVFELPKPDGLFRVIVVGASTVQGYPYSSELSFPRQLQLILDRQLPGKKVEVLNAGIVGISTTPLVDVVAHVMAADPDLLVMYAGHNEYYGIGGVASNIPASGWQFETRRYPLMQALLKRPKLVAEGGDLIASLPRQLEILPNDPLNQRAAEIYEQNVSAIVGICERAKVPLLLCTPVSNLRDQSPLATAADPPPPVAEASPAVAAADEQPADASDSYREECARACRDFPENAAAHYRLARACDAAGDQAAARTAYTQARDLDACRYRAPSRFHEILRRVSDQHPAPAVRLLDLVPLLEQKSTQWPPGANLFLEHVHFNLEGHWLVARALGRAIVEDVLAQPWQPDLVPDIKARDEWLALTPEDNLTAHALAWFLTKETPFDKAVDAKRHQTELEQRVKALAEALGPAGQQRLFRLPDKTKVDDLIDGLGRAFMEEGQAEQALHYFQLSAHRRPWLPNAHVFAAICLHQLGRDEEARASLERSHHTALPPVPAIEAVEAKIRRNLGEDSTGF